MIADAGHQEDLLSHNGRIALIHARSGRPIFPSSGEGERVKTPLVGSWKRWATTVEERILAFWNLNPDALPTFDLEGAGLIVIDADNHGDGPDGVAILEEICAANDYDIDAGPWVKSPHGMHLYFLAPADSKLRNGPNRFPRGVEVKTAGGCIIAPGTRMPNGDEYVLHGRLEAASVLPPFFQAFGGRQLEYERAPALVSASVGERRVVAYADTAFEQELKILRQTPHGRNEQLNRSAFNIGQMVGAGWIGESEAIEGLKQAASDNGYIEKDGIGAAMSSIRSGLVAGRMSPRRSLPAEREVDSALRDRIRASLRSSTFLATRLDDPDAWQSNDGPHSDEPAGQSGEGADPRQRADNEKRAGTDVEPLPTIWASSWSGCIRPQRQYLDARGLFPLGHVSIFTSQGGDGKTLLALQAAIGSCADGKWIGANIRRGKVLFYSAEEPIQEIQIRIDEICEAETIAVADLGGLGIIDLNYEVDASLVNADSRSGAIRLTKLFLRFEHTIAATNPIAVFIDNRGQVVTGNENDRVVASLTIRALELLADRYHCAIILLSHPSLSGINSGSGSSGSTGWVNTARSAVYLSRPKDADDDARMLENIKANYSRKGKTIGLKWEMGRFVCTDPPADSDELGKSDKGERVFMHLLRVHNDRNIRVSASPSSMTFAPKIFAAHSGREKLTRNDFALAMESLLAAGRIENRPVGPPSRNQFGLFTRG